MGSVSEILGGGTGTGSGKSLADAFPSVLSSIGVLASRGYGPVLAHDRRVCWWGILHVVGSLVWSGCPRGRGRGCPRGLSRVHPGHVKSNGSQSDSGKSWNRHSPAILLCVRRFLPCVFSHPMQG